VQIRSFYFLKLWYYLYRAAATANDADLLIPKVVSVLNQYRNTFFGEFSFGLLIIPGCRMHHLAIKVVQTLNIGPSIVI
jgi:hypothetical protein